MSIRTVSNLYTLRRNLRLESEELRKLQNRKLRKILKYAYSNVRFYHEKFDSAKIKPDDIKTIEDLSKIPTTTKSEIQSASMGDIVAKHIDIKKCGMRTTSGSTGIPLKTIVDRETLDLEAATWARALLERGLRLSDRMAVIGDPRGFPKSKNWLHFLRIIRREYLSIFDGPEKQLMLLERFKPDIMQGYPSSLAILADAYEQKTSNVKPRLIFTLGELLDKATRELVSSAFETEIMDNYACSEFSLMAWECKEHTGYHMNVDSVIMEFLNNGDPVEDGERGEIVCTSLLNKAMPLIRYRLGDVGISLEAKCTCGRTLPLMRIVEGRLDDFLMATDGRTISPTVFFPYPFENLDEIRQFRVVQEKKNQLTIQLCVRENYVIEDRFLEKATRELHRLFGEDMQVEFQTVERIPRDPSGKLRKVVSQITGIGNKEYSLQPH